MGQIAILSYIYIYIYIYLYIYIYVCLCVLLILCSTSGHLFVIVQNVPSTIIVKEKKTGQNCHLKHSEAILLGILLFYGHMVSHYIYIYICIYDMSFFLNANARSLSYYTKSYNNYLSWIEDKAMASSIWNYPSCEQLELKLSQSDGRFTTTCLSSYWIGVYIYLLSKSIDMERWFIKQTTGPWNCPHI